MEQLDAIAAPEKIAAGESDVERRKPAVSA
jgi:hypothetical protein